MVTKLILALEAEESLILDPRALVFYHVTDGDKSSGELYVSVARIWLQESLAHARAFKNLASVFC